MGTQKSSLERKGRRSRDPQSKSDSKKKQAARPMDPRFSAAQTDPRFERFPDRRRTVKIDPRFAGKYALLLGHVMMIISLITSLDI